MPGIVSKIESFSCVDGEGPRAVVFFQGCPWRCGYCHNPETQEVSSVQDITPEQLAGRLKRFLPYLKGGGVTFSGGEPLLYADFLSRTLEFLPRVSAAIETAGGLWNAEIEALLPKLDLVLCDVKAVTDEAYQELTGGLTLSRVLEFLARVKKAGCRLWVRQVIVPGYNDAPEQALELEKTVRPYAPEKIELLPFRKIAEEKYRALGRSFPFGAYPEADEQTVLNLQNLLRREET